MVDENTDPEREERRDGSSMDEEGLSIRGPFPILIAFLATGALSLGLFAHLLPRWAWFIWMLVTLALGVSAAAPPIADFWFAVRAGCALGVFASIAFIVPGSGTDDPTPLRLAVPVLLIATAGALSGIRQRSRLSDAWLIAKAVFVSALFALAIAVVLTVGFIAVYWGVACHNGCDL